MSEREDAIRERLVYAAEGGTTPSWRRGRTVGRTIYVQVGDQPSDDDVLIGLMDYSADAELIAHAPADLEYLLGEVARLRENLAERAADSQLAPATSVFSPGPLVVGTQLPGGPTTYQFRPVHTGIQPQRIDRVRYRCPHGSHLEDLNVRYYPDINPPALFVDCCYCEITWEIALAPDLSTSQGSGSSS